MHWSVRRLLATKIALWPIARKSHAPYRKNYSAAFQYFNTCNPLGSAAFDHCSVFGAVSEPLSGGPRWMRSLHSGCPSCSLRTRTRGAAAWTDLDRRTALRDLCRTGVDAPPPAPASRRPSGTRSTAPAPSEIPSISASRSCVSASRLSQPRQARFPQCCGGRMCPSRRCSARTSTSVVAGSTSRTKRAGAWSRPPRGVLSRRRSRRTARPGSAWATEKLATARRGQMAVTASRQRARGSSFRPIIVLDDNDSRR